MKGWYFAHKGNRLNYDDNRLVRVGITHTVSRDRPLALCEYGLHMSERIIDALKYADYHVLYRCESGEDILRDGDKFVSYERTYLARYDLGTILPKFARWAARQNIEKIKPYTSEEDYALIIIWLDTGDKKISLAAESAAEAAAWSAWWSARSAASAAPGSAAAAWSAAWAAQEKQLIKMIEAKYGKIE